MPGVISWICLLLFLMTTFTGFAEQYPCGAGTYGHVALHLDDKTEKPGAIKGTIVTCIKLTANGNYTRAGFCYGGNATFNPGAAAATCRQMGYVKHVDLGTPAQLRTGIPEDIEAVFDNIQCPKVQDYTTEGKINLLRCSHKEPTPFTSLPCELAAVECSETPLIKGDPYHGQVYINKDTVSDSAPYGQVYININGESRPVCAQGYTNATLHSVCQQMGFTEAYTNFTGVPIENEDSWDLGNVSCNGDPSSCFTDCFNVSSVSTVSNCYTGLSVNCIYNETNEGVYGSGSAKLCQIKDTCDPTTADVFIGLFVFSFVVNLICCVCVLPCCIYKMCCAKSESPAKPVNRSTQELDENTPLTSSQSSTNSPT